MKTRDLREPLDRNWLIRTLRDVLPTITMQTWCSGSWGKNGHDYVAAEDTDSIVDAERRCILGHVLAVAHAQGHFVDSIHIVNLDPCLAGDVMRKNDDVQTLAELAEYVEQRLDRAEQRGEFVVA